MKDFNSELKEYIQFTCPEDTPVQLVELARKNFCCGVISATALISATMAKQVAGKSVYESTREELNTRFMELAVRMTEIAVESNAAMCSKSYEEWLRSVT